MIEPQMTHEEAGELAGPYVLGALDRKEEAAVHAHLTSCTESHAEFAFLGSAVPSLLEGGDLELVEPPASLGERIMAAAAADLAMRRSATAVAPDAMDVATSAAAPDRANTSLVAPVPFPSAAERMDRNERRAAARTSRFDWTLRIAAVIAIVAAGTWGLNLQGQLDRARAFDQAIAAVVQAGAQPGAKPVVLASAGQSSPSGIGAVRSDGSVILAMRDLPATSGTQVYEAWVIVPDAAPIAVGGFTVDATGTASFTTRPTATPAGATIALTLEPREGNTAPEGPVVSAGVATTPPNQSS